MCVCGGVSGKPAAWLTAGCWQHFSQTLSTLTSSLPPTWPSIPSLRLTFMAKSDVIAVTRATDAVNDVRIRSSCK